ncbi:hypothetical protein Anapl_00181 [Anas platyrhynchos]|uniref:Uncharacterized protein n=1 Tax=Anas platyrhynchos TaxID=8839 RepID=R0K3D5_ANAPL|nr:hypothetical protein Anapl_00181 [Anas platyrhynchos]
MQEGLGQSTKSTIRSSEQSYMLVRAVRSCIAQQDVALHLGDTLPRKPSLLVARSHFLRAVGLERLAAALTGGHFSAAAHVNYCAAGVMYGKLCCAMETSVQSVQITVQLFAFHEESFTYGYGYRPGGCGCSSYFEERLYYLRLTFIYFKISKDAVDAESLEVWGSVRKYCQLYVADETDDPGSSHCFAVTVVPFWLQTCKWVAVTLLVLNGAQSSHISVSEEASRLSLLTGGCDLPTANFIGKLTVNLPQKALKVFLSIKSLGGQGQETKRHIQLARDCIIPNADLKDGSATACHIHQEPATCGFLAVLAKGSQVFLLVLETSQSLFTTCYVGDWIVPGANEETEDHSEPSDHFKSNCVAVTLKSLTHVTVTCGCEEKLLTAAGQGIPVTVLLRG